VKAWIEEAGQYPQIIVEYTSGDPRFVFYDMNDKIIGDGLEISNFKTQQIHDLLAALGFQRNQ